jgi:hypothetical protein
MRAALVCDACHDLLEVPMILPQCGHTFCSRCIRSYLDCKGPVLGDCPSCREKVRPDELVRNVKLKEVIVQCLLRPIMTFLLPVTNKRFDSESGLSEQVHAARGFPA